MQYLHFYFVRNDNIDITLCLFMLSSGKTTLLFQHAISCASQSKSVLFVTPLGLDQLPLLDKNPSQETLKRIHIM